MGRCFPELLDVVVFPKQGVGIYLSFSIGDEFKVCDYIQLGFLCGMLAETAAKQESHFWVN